jgi:hypothetical protein
MNIAHIHLLLNHVPVIGTFIGIALIAWAILRRSTEVAKTALGLFILLAPIALVVYLTGDPAEHLVEHLPGVTDAAIEAHEEAATVAAIALGGLGVLTLWALVHFRRRALPKGVVLVALAYSLGVGGLMAWTANLGGQIRHTEIRAGALPASARSAAGQGGAIGER